MDTRILVLIIAVAVALAVAAVILVLRQRKSTHLKQQFGPEYHRAVAMDGDVDHAEAVLIDREKRVGTFSLSPLSPVDRERFAVAWAAIQRRFVDDPSSAVNQADGLVNAVLALRGYPMTEAEERAADLSVHYPTLVENYRAARTVMNNRSQSHASTEDLRLAMVNFRALFDELLESPESRKSAA